MIGIKLNTDSLNYIAGVRSKPQVVRVEFFSLIAYGVKLVLLKGYGYAQFLTVRGIFASITILLEVI